MFSIIGVLLIAIVIAIFPLFASTPLCHSTKTDIKESIGRPLFSPDGKKIVFTGYKSVFRPAVDGICTFPDGGGSLIVSEEIFFYIRNIDNAETLRKISSFGIPKDDIPQCSLGLYAQAGLFSSQCSISSASIFAWVDDAVSSSFNVTWHGNDVRVKKIYLKTNTISGKTAMIPDSKGQRILEQVYADKFHITASPLGSGQHLRFSEYDENISIISLDLEPNIENLIADQWPLLLMRMKANNEIQSVLDSAHLSQLHDLKEGNIFSDTAMQKTLLEILEVIISSKDFYRKKEKLEYLSAYSLQDLRAAGVYILQNDTTKKKEIVYPPQLSIAQKRLINLALVRDMTKGVIRNVPRYPVLSEKLLISGVSLIE